MGCAPGPKESPWGRAAAGCALRIPVLRVVPCSLRRELVTPAALGHAGPRAGQGHRAPMLGCGDPSSGVQVPAPPCVVASQSRVDARPRFPAWSIVPDGPCGAVWPRILTAVSPRGRSG
jgi:hypothetical protein